MVFGAYVAFTMTLLFAPVTGSLPSTFFDGFDKVVHFGLFMGIAGLGYWTVPSLRLAIAFGVVMAGGTELLQGPLAYRTADLWDFLAGSGGSLAGGWTAMVLKRWLRGRGPSVDALRR